MCELLTNSEGAQLATLVACGEASVFSCWADVPSCQLCFKQLHEQSLEVTYSFPFSSTQEGWRCRVLVRLCCLSKRDCDKIQVEYWIVNTFQGTYTCEKLHITLFCFVLSVTSPTENQNQNETRKKPTPFSSKQTPFKDPKVTFEYHIISVSGKFLPGNGSFSVTNEPTLCSS